MTGSRRSPLAALVLVLSGCSLGAERDPGPEQGGRDAVERAVDRTNERSSDLREPDPELRAGKEWVEGASAREVLVAGLRQVRGSGGVRVRLDDYDSYGRGSGADLRYDADGRCAGTVRLDQDPPLQVVEDGDLRLVRSTRPGWEALLSRTAPTTTGEQRSDLAVALAGRWVTGVDDPASCAALDGLLADPGQATAKGLQADVGAEQGIVVFLRAGRAVVDLRPPHALLELVDDDGTVTTFSEHGAVAPVRVPPAGGRLDLRDLVPTA